MPSDLSLPELRCAPVRTRRGYPDRRAGAGLDALLVLASTTEQALWARLPEPRSWRRLHARTAPAELQSRSMTLANARQTQALLGYVRPRSSCFERLSFAGRLVRALAARKPRRVGLIVPASVPEAALWCEALLSAVWSESFSLPDFRARPAERWALRQIELYAEAGTGPGAGAASKPGVRAARATRAPPALPLERIRAAACAGNLTRWLTALPPNRLDARAYRRLLFQDARRHGLRLTWYSEQALRRLGAGAFLAVARGSAARTAGIARLAWRGARRSGPPDVALVGKGVVFDTGGINLKPHRHMLEMHTDMAGSAVAFATLLALVQLRAPLNADAWLAICDNSIGPNAYRPQEVVRALNGTSIQIVHSDAEGRLALADALALAARTAPRLTLDFGTLTGACVQALTERYSGVFTNRPELAPALVAAGAASGERVWPFPLDEDFDADLASANADVLQCAVDGKGDHILAARFLRRFVAADRPWVHVDLSAATRRGGLAHVASEVTGFGPRFALELLLSRRWQERAA